MQFTTATYLHCYIMVVCCGLQVALEVIEELCYEMGLHRLEAISEYAIFLVISRGTLIDVYHSDTHILWDLSVF